MEMKNGACNQHITNTVLYTDKYSRMRNKKDGVDGMVDRLQARKTGFVFDCII